MMSLHSYGCHAYCGALNEVCGCLADLILLAIIVSILPYWAGAKVGAIIVPCLSFPVACLPTLFL